MTKVYLSITQYLYARMLQNSAAPIHTVAGQCLFIPWLDSVNCIKPLLNDFSKQAAIRIAVNAIFLSELGI